MFGFDLKFLMNFTERTSGKVSSERKTLEHVYPHNAIGRHHRTRGIAWDLQNISKKKLNLSLELDLNVTNISCDFRWFYWLAVWHVHAQLHKFTRKKWSFVLTRIIWSKSIKFWWDYTRSSLIFTSSMYFSLFWPSIVDVYLRHFRRCSSFLYIH